MWSCEQNVPKEWVITYYVWLVSNFSSRTCLSFIFVPGPMSSSFFLNSYILAICMMFHKCSFLDLLRYSDFGPVQISNICAFYWWLCFKMQTRDLNFLIILSILVKLSMNLLGYNVNPKREVFNDFVHGTL